MLGHESRHEDVGAGGNLVAADLLVADGLAPEAPGRRIEAHRFGEHLLGESQRREVSLE